MEKRSIDYVPLAERRGHGRSLWPIWFAGSTHLTTMAVGLIGIGLGGGLFWTAIAILAGSALGTLIVAGHAAQGPRLGLPQLIQARTQFGYYGALIVYGVALTSYTGYAAFGQILAGQTLHALSGMPQSAGGIAYAATALLIAIAGFRLFKLVQRWLAFALVGMLGLYSVVLIAGLPALSATGFKTAPVLLQIAAAATYQLSWAPYISDYSRYLPRKTSTRSTYWWTFSGAFLGGSWGMLIGAATAASLPGATLAGALVALGDRLFPGFGTGLLCLILVGLTTAGALNFYGASLTLLSIADTVKPLAQGAVKRIVATLAVGAVTMTIALSASADFVRGFSAFLAILLNLVVPWIAITLVDFYLVRRGHYAIGAILKPSRLYGQWNWRGLAAYGLGFAVATLLHPLAGMVLAGLIYRVLCLSYDVAREWRQIRLIDRDLEPVAPAA